MRTLSVCLAVTAALLQFPAFAAHKPDNVPAHGQEPSLQQKLIHAILQDQAAVVKSLLANGADPNARSTFAADDTWFLSNQPNNDQTPPPLVVACSFSGFDSPIIVKELLDQGALVNCADSNGVTPLMAAAEIGGEVMTLIKRHARVNAEDNNGKTPLMYAMNNLTWLPAAQLLDHGAKINAKDHDGETPLLIAISQARHNTILLIGEDTRKKAIAEKASYLDMIQLLIDRRSNVNARDAAGNSPLKVALTLNEQEVAGMLRKSGAK